MKKNKFNLLLLLCLVSFQSFGQANASFAIEGKIRTVLATDSQKENGRLTSGGEVSFSSSQGITEIVVKYGKTAKVVTAVEPEATATEELYIQVFEYDFDQDGKPELCIAHSSGVMAFKVEVYRYSGGLTELVGNFDGQMRCEIAKNAISFPYGTQGLSSDYIYANGSFFELVYHDPSKKEQTGQ
jgi:hypothetical protein